MSKRENFVLVHGEVASGFEGVAEQFTEHLLSGEERGAALCVTKDHEVVVDLWGGYSNAKDRLPWQQESAAVVFSVTKALTATVMLHLHQAGKFDYDAPVAEYWPEFAQKGKGEITVRTLLNHRAGLPALDQVLSLEQATDPRYTDEVGAILARQKPLWPPGEQQAYHAATYGLYAAQLYRRLCDQPIGEYFQEHIAGPLGADIWLGAGEDLNARIASLTAPAAHERISNMLPHILKGGTTEANVGRAFLKPGSVAKRALLNPKVRGPIAYNAPNVRKHPVLWAGAVATARGLAQLFGALANEGAFRGTRLFQRKSIAPIYDRQSWSPQDPVLGKAVGWSQGFLKEEVGLFSDNPESFGHSGLGGSLGWADPINRVSIGYTTNHLDWRVRSPRCLRLCHKISLAVQKIQEDFLAKNPFYKLLNP